MTSREPVEMRPPRARRAAPAPLAAAPTAGSPLAAFPGLAHLLGGECFHQLSVAAAARSAAVHCEPGAVVHSLLVQREAPRPAHVPSRLAADLAALEWAIAEVARLAPLVGNEPRLPHDALDGLPSSAWERTLLQPLRSLRLLPVAFRLASYLRRIHHGGRAPPAPRREEQYLVVYATPGQGDLPPCAWWHSLPPAEGRLLAALALGTPLGLATREAVARGAIAGEKSARALLASWLRDGFFTSLHTDA